MSPSFIETVACHWCTKSKPLFRVHRLSNQQVVCDYCLEWHLHALEFLGGAVPRGCQVCERTWETLRVVTIGGTVRMFVVPKDGFLQMLCAECVAPYLPKQKQLYKGTQFGAEVLKI